MFETNLPDCLPYNSLHSKPKNILIRILLLQNIKMGVPLVSLLIGAR